MSEKTIQKTGHSHMNEIVSINGSEFGINSSFCSLCLQICSIVLCIECVVL